MFDDRSKTNISCLLIFFLKIINIYKYLKQFIYTLNSLFYLLAPRPSHILVCRLISGTIFSNGSNVAPDFQFCYFTDTDQIFVPVSICYDIMPLFGTLVCIRMIYSCLPSCNNIRYVSNGIQSVTFRIYPLPFHFNLMKVSNSRCGSQNQLTANGNGIID